MENLQFMAVTEKVRTGPKKKAPGDIHKPIVHYAPQREIDEFGGIEFAREFADTKFQEHLAKIRAGKVKKGKFQ